MKDFNTFIKNLAKENAFVVIVYKLLVQKKY